MLQRVGLMSTFSLRNNSGIVGTLPSWLASLPINTIDLGFTSLCAFRLNDLID